MTQISRIKISDFSGYMRHQQISGHYFFILQFSIIDDTYFPNWIRYLSGYSKSWSSGFILWFCSSGFAFLGFRTPNVRPLKFLGSWHILTMEEFSFWVVCSILFFFFCALSLGNLISLLYLFFAIGWLIFWWEVITVDELCCEISLLLLVNDEYSWCWEIGIIGGLFSVFENIIVCAVCCHGSYLIVWTIGWCVVLVLGLWIGWLKSEVILI